MQVKFYAALRDLVGVSRLHIPTEGTTTVGDVLESLVRVHPALDAKIWDDRRNLTGFVAVYLNGRSVEYLQGLETPVKDTDVLALFPPVGGGSG